MTQNRNGMILLQADFDAMAQSDNVNFDNYADNISLQTARMVAEPASQRNRSNILNAVTLQEKIYMIKNLQLL